MKRRDLAAVWHGTLPKHGMLTRHLRQRQGNESLLDYAREMERVIRQLEARLYAKVDKAQPEDAEDVADAERTKALWDSRTDSDGSDKGFVKLTSVQNQLIQTPKP